MKFLKPFKLFEAEGYPNPEDITEDQVMLIFNDPDRAPIFFSPEGDEQDKESAQVFLRILDDMEEEITPLQFLNFTKYLVKIDDFKLAKGIMMFFFKMKHYLFNPEYLRKTLYFDEHYHPNELDQILKIKKENEIMEPDEDWIDIRAEIAALEGGGSGRSSEVLSGRDLQNAIDSALDKRDFKEVERLSKMLPECYGFSFTKKISLFS
jgi:hypothetical protein